MLKLFFRSRVLPLVCGLILAAPLAAFAAPFNIVNIPADVYTATTLGADGVYAFKPGAYTAADTGEVTFNMPPAPPTITSGGFPGSLSLGEGVDLAATGTGAAPPTYNVGLALTTGNFSQSGGSIIASG